MSIRWCVRIQVYVCAARLFMSYVHAWSWIIGNPESRYTSDRCISKVLFVFQIVLAHNLCAYALQYNFNLTPFGQMIPHSHPTL